MDRDAGNGWAALSGYVAENVAVMMGALARGNEVASEAFADGVASTIVAGRAAAGEPAVAVAGCVVERVTLLPGVTEVVADSDAERTRIGAPLTS